MRAISSDKVKKIQIFFLFAYNTWGNNKKHKTKFFEIVGQLCGIALYIKIFNKKLIFIKGLILGILKLYMPKNLSQQKR